MPMSTRRPLTFDLDFDHGVPAYLQIVGRIERLAADRRLAAGDQLPTVRELAVELGLNFNTVARAYRLLHAAGVVSTQRGRGTYVLEARPASAGRRARRQTLEKLTRRFVEEARQQKVSAEDIERAVRRQLVMDGTGK
jgi:GntR family transcriptional regulator